MHLKRERKLYIAAHEGGPQLPLTGGVFQQKSRFDSTKHRWFALGMEASSQEELLTTVKVITLRFQRRKGDLAQELLLNSHGKQLLLWEKNGEIMGESAICTVEIHGEDEGYAQEPQIFTVSLHISQEIPVDVKV